MTWGGFPEHVGPAFLSLHVRTKHCATDFDTSVFQTLDKFSSFKEQICTLFGDGLGPALLN